MVIATIASVNVMAVTCYDTGDLLTLTVHADGTLTALGSVGGFGTPYPGMALDGTNVLIPLFTTIGSFEGGVAKVSIASPAVPAVTGVATLVAPVPGTYTNPGFLAVAAGNIFVAAGSEAQPLATTSTIQVVNEATMTLVGEPFVVAHSPQRLTVTGGVAYVASYDATQMESIDVSDPANLRPLEIVSLTSDFLTCHAIPIAVRGTLAFVGCYVEGFVEVYDVSDPSHMQLVQTIQGIEVPQDFYLTGPYLLVTGGLTGGPEFEITLGTN